MLVSSSDDLTLIQWSLTDIICDFYNTDDDQLGTRNDNKPDLPTLTYRAPPEIDRSSIPKEERKRLRRETKRLKRLRANDLIKRAVTAVTRGASRVREEGLTGVTEPGKEDGGDEDDDRAGAGAGEDRSRDGSDDEAEEGAQRAAQGTAEEEEEGEEEEGGAKSPDLAEKEGDEELGPAATAKEDGACSSPTRTEAAAAEMSDSHPNLPDLHGLMRRSLSTNKVVPVDAAESASAGFTMVKSFIGKMLGIGGTEKVGIEPEASSNAVPSATTAGTEVTELDILFFTGTC